jgi:soluble lytic murein transglycosylase-like protein
VGARGYMQVMPFWTRVIGDGDPGKLFHMQTNLRFGCVILRHYLDRERGDLFLALGRYNGGQLVVPSTCISSPDSYISIMMSEPPMNSPLT